MKLGRLLGRRAEIVSGVMLLVIGVRLLIFISYDANLALLSVNFSARMGHSWALG